MQPFDDLGDDFGAFRLVERLVAQARQDAPLHAGSAAEWFAERVGTRVSAPPWITSVGTSRLARSRARPLHRLEQLGAEPGRGARLDQRIGEVGDAHGRIAGKLIAGDRVGQDDVGATRLRTGARARCQAGTLASRGGALKTSRSGAGRSEQA